MIVLGSRRWKPSNQFFLSFYRQNVERLEKLLPLRKSFKISVIRTGSCRLCTCWTILILLLSSTISFRPRKGKSYIWILYSSLSLRLSVEWQDSTTGWTNVCPLYMWNSIPIRFALAHTLISSRLLKFLLVPLFTQLQLYVS